MVERPVEARQVMVQFHPLPLGSAPAMEPRSRIRGGTVRKTGALGLSGFESRDFHEHVGCGAMVARLLVRQ